MGCRCGQLEEQVEQLQLDVAEKHQANIKLEQQLALAASTLQRKHRLMAEVGSSTCIAWLNAGVASM
jgi:SMC interacting uncharacterized protein involved in chromosome segregation